MLGGAGEHDRTGDAEAEDGYGQGRDAMAQPALLVFLDVLYQGAPRMRGLQR